VNSCHRSHQQKKKKKWKIGVFNRRLNCYQLIQTKLWNTIASKLMNYNDMVWFVIQNEIMGIFSMQTGGFMNFVIILISTQITHFKPTSNLIHLKCTLTVSILLRIILFHHSILKNPAPSPLSQYITSILSQSFSHRKHFASYDIIRERY
jgi:hypothetical protein